MVLRSVSTGCKASATRSYLGDHHSLALNFRTSDNEGSSELGYDSNNRVRLDTSGASTAISGVI